MSGEPGSELGDARAEVAAGSWVTTVLPDAIPDAFLGPDDSSSAAPSSGGVTRGNGTSPWPCVTLHGAVLPSRRTVALQHGASPRVTSHGLRNRAARRGCLVSPGFFVVKEKHSEEDLESHARDEDADRKASLRPPPPRRAPRPPRGPRPSGLLSLAVSVELSSSKICDFCPQLFPQ